MMDVFGLPENTERNGFSGLGALGYGEELWEAWLIKVTVCTGSLSGDKRLPGAPKGRPRVVFQIVKGSEELVLQSSLAASVACCSFQKLHLGPCVLSTKNHRMGTPPAWFQFAGVMAMLTGCGGRWEGLQAAGQLDTPLWVL